jgi:putative component of membrane protein insertase Oxa1/YidC/SpoIIIJ protein YidD
MTALVERGAVVGLGLTAIRLAKCAPWHPGGWDPVPPRRRTPRGRPRGHRTGDASSDRSA